MICIDGRYDAAHGFDPAWLSGEGLQFGIGLFETLRAYQDGEVVGGLKLEDLPQHLHRIKGSAEALGIAVPEAFLKEDMLLSCLQPILQSMKGPVGAVKLTLVKTGCSSHWWAQERSFAYSKGQLDDGLAVCLSQVRRSSSSIMQRHKSLNYGDNWLERQKAVENCYQEVIFLNENGFLTEGSVSNLFFKKDGVFYTPRLDNGLLDGIMRQRLIEALSKGGQTVREGDYTLEQLLCADQVLLTNALMGIAAVRRIESKTYEPLDQATLHFIQLTDPVRALL